MGLIERRSWLCQQYLGYRSLVLLQAGRLNGRNGAETVSRESRGDRPDTLRSGSCGSTA